MRIICWHCHKAVSNELPNDTVFRAIAVCPECIEKENKHVIIIPVCKKCGAYDLIDCDVCPVCGGEVVDVEYIPVSLYKER